MPLPTVRVKMPTTRYITPSRRRAFTAPALPGGPPEGLDASYDQAGSQGLVGGVGLPEMRESNYSGDLPMLPSVNRSSVSPGLSSPPPIYDLARADAMQTAARAEAPYKQLKAAKDIGEVSSMALASPEAAQELGGLAARLGLRGVGSAISQMRAGALPGAPAMPGSPTLPDGQKDFAMALANTVAQMRRERPFEPVSKLANEAVKGLMAAQFQAHLERSKLLAQYVVKMEQEPALIRAKDAAELEGYTAATPSYIARSRGQEAAQQDEQTRGFGARQERETKEMEKRVPIEVRKAGETQQARESAMTQGATERKRKGLQAELQFKPMIEGAEERARNAPLQERQRQATSIKAAEFDRQLKARLVDFESRLARTTREMTERKRLGIGKGGAAASKAMDPRVMAWKEATKMLGELSEDQVKGLGGSLDKPGAALDALYEQFLQVATKASIDPTARAVIERFSR